MVSILRTAVLASLVFMSCGSDMTQGQATPKKVKLERECNRSHWGKWFAVYVVPACDTDVCAPGNVVFRRGTDLWLDCQAYAISRWKENGCGIDSLSICRTPDSRSVWHYDLLAITEDVRSFTGRVVHTKMTPGGDVVLEKTYFLTGLSDFDAP